MCPDLCVGLLLFSDTGGCVLFSRLSWSCSRVAPGKVLQLQGGGGSQELCEDKGRTLRSRLCLESEQERGGSRRSGSPWEKPPM